MERLKHLVVVLPGILGSELVDARGRPVWGPGMWQIARKAGLDPSVLSVEENPCLTPVGLMSTITVVPPILRWPGYDVLVRNIKNTFADVRDDTARPGWLPKPGTGLLLVPYDFRTGVVAAAEYVRDRVAEQLAVQPGRRVIVVAHSMGGLVARYWLGCLEDPPSCDAVITLGTPHGGAPKALDVLVNGVRLGVRRFRRLTEVARGWPSVYDLLPRYPAVAVAEEARQYSYELEILTRMGLAHRARAAYDVHRDIDTGWAELEAPPHLRAVFSRGHPTLIRADMDRDVLSVRETVAEWLPNPAWKGDGTVPADCAIPNDLTDRRAWQPVPQRHLPMASAAVVTELLRDYTADAPTAMRGPGDESAPSLGVGLDETYPAGEPLTVSVELVDAAADEDTLIQVKALPEDGTEQPPTAFGVRSGDRWTATLPGLAAGTYTIRVDGVNVPGHNDIRCEDIVGVIDV